MGRDNPFEIGAEVNYAPHQCIWKMSVTYVNDKTQETEVVEFGYPLTIEFNIHKSTDAQTNTGQFKIYNLSQATYSKLFKERLNTSVFKTVKFEAGYGTETQCFIGHLQEGYTYRQGTETITHLDCWDIGIGERYLAVTFDAGTTFKEAFKNIASKVPDLDIGELGGFEGKFLTPTTLAGTPFEILNKITHYHTFIDNGKVKTLMDNECIDVPVYQIRAESGLLQTPQLRGGQMIVTSLFRPEVILGQLFEITSKIQSEFSGTYKLCGYTHSGTISGAVSGQRTTQLNLLVGGLLQSSSKKLTNSNKVGFEKVKQEEVTPVNQKYGSSVEEVYRYIRDTKGKIPRKQITKNIWWNELIGQNNTDNERYSELKIEYLHNCVVIAQRLQSLLDANFGGRTIKVISGWRSRRNNASVDGKTNSRHLVGSAIDFVIIGVDSKTAWYNVFNSAFSTKNKNFSYVNKYGSIHIQIGIGL